MAQSIPGEKDPQILVPIREFLDGLNKGGGKPMEEMAPGLSTSTAVAGCVDVGSLFTR